MEIVAGVYSLRNLDDGIIAVNGKDKIVFDNVFLYDFENKITSFLKLVFNEDFLSSTNKYNCNYCDHNSIF
jgi:hypothetical protein